MKLEELRERLRAEKHTRGARTPGSAQTKRLKRRKSRKKSPGLDFSIPLHMATCCKCKNPFEPDATLRYVPDVCASCESYL